ncbi:MAG: hypothetical protein M1833_006042 [Piccolia ochrophora]|nr:MAG: hypothetical protein M1833_006042 [Piccolia ochrophora]
MSKQSLSSIVDRARPDLSSFESLYKDLHAHPELSLQEEKTTARAATFLRDLPGFHVVEHIGGHGMVGLLENGAGRTVLLRADTDALPVEEKTRLPYASRVVMTDVEDGTTKPVMHACGHDVHVTCMLAAAQTLHHAQEDWKGTLIVLFQPNEERAGGAEAMVHDGLYDRVPVPDVVLGQHVMPARAGTLGTRRHLMGQAADSFRVTLYGRGAHGSQPHASIDVVVMAAHLVTRLQTIVSREVAPRDSAVVTVGSIQAGSAENVIPETAVLKINVRTVSPQSRERVLASLRRIINAECEASNAPKPPLIEETTRFPFMYNDDKATQTLETAFSDHFGDSYSSDCSPLGGSEDFPHLATCKDIPSCYWTFGGVDPSKWDEAKKQGRLDEDIPINHSPYFAPVIQPTIKTGVDALAVAALAFLT